MNVTEVERKESTKHCCGNGCRRRDSAEHEEEGGALIGKRITENNVTKADRGVDGMGVDELLQYLKDNGEELRESILAGQYRPAPVRRVEIPKENGKKRKLGIPTAVDRVIQQAIALEHIIPYIERKLFLKVNLEKTVVSYAGKIKFLGHG
ncbi:hypothetical protein SDC9_121446 [bioreactor metagenome]|jgi:hypothetical protein|uniref:Reverse transcriptase domain-containing protein n=1 Tax=bioreactor metagenome TaxID=1076179 RepID=A0A645CC43_9ZZZZ